MVKLVGILNVTPDSFSDGGQYFASEDALEHAASLFDEGADLVDIGAESTRPGAPQLTPDEEWSRLEKVLPELLKTYPGKLSLDTRHASTALSALALGDIIINDVTGMNNEAMREVVLQRMARVVISHLPGTDIQVAHASTEPVSDIDVVRQDLLAQAEHLLQAGLPKEHIILDPGIGFGKTMELNSELLKFAELVPEYDVMIGYSRKRFLGERRMELEPNLAAADVAIAHGAAYLRVHDVAGHKAHLSQTA